MAQDFRHDDELELRHDAAAELLREYAPPGAYDEEPRSPEPSPDDDESHMGDLADAGALKVLRRGLAVTPELKEGLALTVVLAVVTAAGKLALPILIQQVLDRGVRGPDGFRPTFVYGASAATAVAVVLLYLLGRATYLRLVRATEASLLSLRLKAFGHIHRLSVAEHSDQRRGALVARVTSDVETLAQFTEWGAVAWIVDLTIIAGAFGVMGVYDWRLALQTMLLFAPIAIVLPWLQRRQLDAQDEVRTVVGETFSEVSEAITGASIVRAYGLERSRRGRLADVIQRQYKVRMRAAAYSAATLPVADIFGSIGVAGAVATGVYFGPGWGMDFGEVVAFLFLIGLLLNPLGEISEIVDRTQIGIAGWRKILGILATPIDVPEPTEGVELPGGPLSIEASNLHFAYRDGIPVLRDVDLYIEPGTRVAVVGETGSGKTTFAKLLTRLADPTIGSLRVGGVCLQDLSPAGRRRAIRMVPQDGFLFDASVGDNVRLGRMDATDDEIRDAFKVLGLGWWLDDLPLGLTTPVGERGANLSVGERQLVALARAQLGDPGLLVLDEATSAVDPETERALTEALARLAEGRTMVSIAHRLSTAEAADLVLVFENGRVVERGSHDELVELGGAYAKLYESWLGSTRAA